MSEKATPRPWRRGKSGDAQFIFAIGDGTRPAVTVAELWYGTLSREERNANADLIVTAVNSHDALVETCELAQQYIEWELAEYLGHHPQTLNAYEKIKAALAKARG